VFGVQLCTPTYVSLAAKLSVSIPLSVGLLTTLTIMNKKKLMTIKNLIIKIIFKHSLPQLSEQSLIFSNMFETISIN
jgi:hypothetical protein